MPSRPKSEGEGTSRAQRPPRPLTIAVLGPVSVKEGYRVVVSGRQLYATQEEAEAAAELLRARLADEPRPPAAPLAPPGVEAGPLGGYRQIPDLVEFNGKISEEGRIVYGALLYWDLVNGCTASNDTLATMLDRSKRTVSRGVAELIEAGVVYHREEPQTKQSLSGRRVWCRYVVEQGQTIERPDPTKQEQEPIDRSVQGRPTPLVRSFHQRRSGLATREGDRILTSPSPPAPAAESAERPPPSVDPSTRETESAPLTGDFVPLAYEISTAQSAASRPPSSRR